MDTPRPASTPSRTPSAALTRRRPLTVTVTSVVPWRKIQVVAAGTSLLVNDGLMRDEITGGLRHAVRFEIGARADHERSALSDFARGES